MSTISELSPVKFVSYSSEYEKIEDHPFIEAIKYDIYHFMYKLGYGTKKLLGKSDLLLIDKNKLDKGQIKKNELVWERFLSGNIIQIEGLIFSNYGVTPLLHSKWGQNFPYNMYTPLYRWETTPSRMCSNCNGSSNVLLEISRKRARFKCLQMEWTNPGSKF